MSRSPDEIVVLEGLKHCRRVSILVRNSCFYPRIVFTVFSDIAYRRKLRKPPSGYVIYAGEVRKKLLHERPDAPFGEISREVGLLWRQMPANERDVYERKAQLIKRRMEEEESQVKARLAIEQQQQQQQNLLQQQQQQQQQNPHVGGPVFGGPGLHPGGIHPDSLSRGAAGSVENNLI
ncbi:unnamed protein product, partial [Dibothriocephalus latus]